MGLNVTHETCRIYIGTYTSGRSEGIYTLTLDPFTGKLGPTEVAAHAANPSYLAVSPSRHYLYTLVSMEVEGKPQGAIEAFAIESSTGALRFINRQLLHSQAPCHIRLGQDRKWLFAANYQEGTVSVLPIHPDGSVGAVTDTAVHQGAGPNIERQDKPHAHYVTQTPDAQHLCGVDLGIDRIVIYDLQGSRFIAREDLNVVVRPGSGPRHLAFHPGGKYVYLVTELSSELIVYEYSPHHPWKTIQTVTTLPTGYRNENLGSAVKVTPNGRFVYASNRGHDSVAVFLVAESTGMLKLVGHVATRGHWPRDLEIDPAGKYLVVANQYSNSVVIFAIDANSGWLKMTDQCSIPDPACVKFLPWSGEDNESI